MDSAALLLLRASIILSVFVIGLKTTLADTIFFLRRPAHLARALVSMNVVMPLIAWMLVAAFSLHPAVKIALIAISVSPIPPVLPKKALSAGGEHQYTIGLLSATSVLSIVLIPATMEAFAALSGAPVMMPPKVVAKLVLSTILGPLTVGILLRNIAPAFGDRVAKPIGTLASLLLVSTALPVLIGPARAALSLVGDGTIASLTAFALTGLIAGHVLGGPETDDRLVLALATASRHPAIALAIAHENFPLQHLAGPAVLGYLILSQILLALYLLWVKRSRRRLTACADSGLEQ